MAWDAFLELQPIVSGESGTTESAGPVPFEGFHH